MGDIKTTIVEAAYVISLGQIKIDDIKQRIVTRAGNFYLVITLID